MTESCRDMRAVIIIDSEKSENVRKKAGRLVSVLGQESIVVELSVHFEDGKNISVFKSFEEALEKAEYYLMHEDIRTEVAKAGRAVVEKYYTYDAALRVMLGNDK